MKHFEAPYLQITEDAPARPPGAAQLAAGRQPGSDSATEVRDEVRGGRPVRVRVVIVLVLGLVGLAIGLHLLHDHQMHRMAGVFLERSEQARADGQVEAAIAWLEQYLRFVPSDSEARLRLGLMLADQVRTPMEIFRVALLLESIVRRDEVDRPEVRERLAELYQRIGRHSDAKFHFEILLTTDSRNPRWREALARCVAELGDYEVAAKEYRAAIDASPRSFSAYEGLAELLTRKLERPAEAEALLNGMVARYPNEPDGLLARARFRRDQGQLEPALLDAKRAYVLAPDDHEVLLLVGRLLAGLTDSAAAAPHFSVRDVQRRVESAIASGGDPLDLIVVAAQLDVLSGRADLAEQRAQAALESHPDDPSLRWLLTEILLRRSDLRAAGDELQRLRSRQEAPELINYLEARIDMQTGDWLAARQRLESIPLGRIEVPYLRAQIHRYLAHCYGRLGQRERQLQAFEESLTANPLLAEARIERAEALAASGRIQDALSHYQQVSHEPGVPLAIARLLLVLNAARSEDTRNWEEVESALNRAAADRNHEREVLLLRASMLVARGEADGARAIIAAAVERQPGDIELRLTLSELHQRCGESDRAVQVLDEAERRFGPRIEVDVARVRHWARSSESEAGPRLEELVRSRERSAAEQFIILSALARAHRRLGDEQRTADLLEQATALEADHLDVWNDILELAIRLGDDQRARRALGGIRRIEGAQGVNWRIGEAARLTMRARRSGDREALARARELLESAARTSASIRISLGLADLAELDGDEALAIEHYQQAIDRGDRNPDVIRRVVELLYRRRRYSDAEHALNKLRELEGVEADEVFGRLAAHVYLHANRAGEAVTLAERRVRDSSDPLDHLWLGQVRWAAGQLEAAEAGFRAAIDLEPSRPESWVALVTFLARNARTAEAEAAVEAMQQALPADEQRLPAAQCHEVLGRLDAAAGEYHQALAADGEDPAVVWSAASYFLRQERLADAEPLLQQIVSDERRFEAQIVRGARRGLALLLAARGGYPNFREGLALLDSNVQSDGGTPDDLRVRVHVLATRPERRYQSEALSALLRLSERVSLTNDDHEQLIQLHANLGNWSAARAAMHAMMAGGSSDPEALSFCIRLTLARGEVRGAVESWLQTLVSLQPESADTVELQARHLALSGDIPAAVKLLSEWLQQQPDDDTQLDRIRLAAAVLSEIAARLDRTGQTLGAEQLAAEAERHYRQLVARSPGDAPELIRFLGKRWRFSEALELCESAWDDAPPESVAVACVELLHTGRLAEHDIAKVRRWIATARETHPQSAELAFQAALAANFAGDYDAAEAACRQTISLAPGAVPAYNDLAWLLAMRRQNLDESLQLINRAIELAGPLGHLLDTRAVVYLARGDTREAIRDAEDAIDERSTAGRLFRLAQAQTAAGDSSSARLAYRNAVAAGLHTGSVHPLEVPELKRLGRELGRGRLPSAVPEPPARPAGAVDPANSHSSALQRTFARAIL